MVTLICGRICSGKSTYAQELRQRRGAALLSVDEIMLAIFGGHCGDRHDEYAENTQKYLFEKSLELLESGVDVILDWGFWSREARASAREFYKLRGAECELHYLDVSDKTWKQRLERRNSAVLAGEVEAYFVDDNLARKFEATFEPPHREEIDVWLTEDAARQEGEKYLA